MKIRAIQFSPTLGNVSKNMEFHRLQITQAITDKIELIIFPELSISGYFLKDIIYDIALTPNDPTLRMLEALSRDIDILVGAPFEEIPGIIYNCALYFSHGTLLHTHRKVQLPNFGMFEEGMIFKAGDTFQSFPLEKSGFTAGILICREILFPINAYLYYLQNVDFLIAISNSPFRGLGPEGMASLKLWERLGEVFAIHHHQHYIFVNRSGFEDGIGFGGGSFFAEAGRGIVKKGNYFEDDSFDVDISMQSVRSSRISHNYARDEKPDLILKELKRILHA